MWCLHGRVKALNFLSRLSLRQWCQALAEKKDDFINDLINHQNSPSPHIPLLFILLAHHSSFSFFQSLISRTHTYSLLYIETHTCSFSRHCNTSSLVLSLSSRLQLALSQTSRQQKSQKAMSPLFRRHRIQWITTTKGQLSLSLPRTEER